MSRNTKLSKYKNMWVFAMFDLPVTDKEKRRQYTKFRKFLLSEGFSMLQYSVYAKFCSSRESGEKYYRHIKAALPPEGEVRIFMITDKQFEEMSVFYGIERKEVEAQPEQLLLF
jgi:CRISPR-associated protein Cas2